MKKLILASLFLFVLSMGLEAQNWTPVSGRYSYTFLKIDSLLYLPNGPTSNRPAPIIHSYWLRFNTDSSGFEYSDGVAWKTFARRVPDDWSILATDPALTRDTTISYPCGNLTFPYVRFYLPQFKGFRIRAFQYYQFELPTDPAYTCSFGPPVYYWDPIGTILTVPGLDTRTQPASVQVTAY